jgi:lipid II isoglutaminyl synthase (glutamine-hydrolysing)
VRLVNRAPARGRAADAALGRPGPGRPAPGQQPAPGQLAPGQLAPGQPAGTSPGRPSAQVRLALALAAGKAAGTASKVLGFGGGTSFPGRVARWVDPHVLRKVAAASDLRTVVVTGSNGKTTTCRILAALASAGGLDVVQNRSGSNLLQGVISAALVRADLRGHLDAQLLLLEVDELVLSKVIPDVQPDTFLVTNIFRDQLDRFGELYSMARDIESVIEELPATATVVLNGDDPLVASFAPAAQARRLYFGIRDDRIGTQLPEHAADTIRCVHCQHPLRYRVVHVSHLGDYECPECGNARPELDVAVTSIQPSQRTGSEITVDTPAGAFSLHVPLAGMHNIYNAAAALACASTLSLPRPLEPSDARRAIDGVRPAFGRLEEIRAGDRRVMLAFVKNPTSYNTTMREVLRQPGRKHILAAHSNTVVDGEDFAWLWDVDLEQLVPQMASLTVSGTRAEEVALRFKYAGVNPAAMQVVRDRAAALDLALAGTPSSEPLCVFAGYTPMRELRNVMQHRGWVPPFWKE